MKKLNYSPTQIQQNLDNRGKTLGGCEKNTYDSEPDQIPFFSLFIMPESDRIDINNQGEAV